MLGSTKLVTRQDIRLARDHWDSQRCGRRVSSLSPPRSSFTSDIRVCGTYIQVLSLGHHRCYCKFRGHRVYRAWSVLFSLCVGSPLKCSTGAACTVLYSFTFVRPWKPLDWFCLC